MSLAFRLAACGLAAMTSFAPPLDAGGRPSIDIVVHDSAGVPPGVLGAARTITASVFARAAIRIAWWDVGRADCITRLPPDAATRRALLTSIFTVRIAAGAPEGRRATAATLAQAVTGTRLVSVFYARIGQYARETGLDPAIVLGHVIAHELGHLLLESASHSVAGLMRSTLDVPLAAQGRLQFSDDEARTMMKNATGQDLCE